MRKMKIRKIAPICAMLLLWAGCSQEIEIPGPDADKSVEARKGEEATVTVSLADAEIDSRAVGTYNKENAIREVTILFFDAAGNIIGTPQVKDIKGTDFAKPMKFATTTEATQMVAIANINLTNAKTMEGAVVDMKNVKTLNDLKGLEYDTVYLTLLPWEYKTTSLEGNLPMSGYAPISFSTHNQGSATVKLHYLVAKIAKVNLQLAKNILDEYAESESQINFNKNKNFTFKRMFLQAVQSKTRLFPQQDMKAASWEGYTFAPKTPRYCGGTEWIKKTYGPEPYPDPVVVPHYEEKLDFINLKASKTIPAGKTYAGGADFGNVMDPKVNKWYPCETQVGKPQTMLVFEVVALSGAIGWNLGETDSFLFPIKLDGSMRDSAGKPIKLQAGQQYDLTVTFTKTFNLYHKDAQVAALRYDMNTSSESNKLGIDVRMDPATWDRTHSINQAF